MSHDECENRSSTRFFHMHWTPFQTAAYKTFLQSMPTILPSLHMFRAAVVLILVANLVSLAASLVSIADSILAILVCIWLRVALLLVYRCNNIQLS